MSSKLTYWDYEDAAKEIGCSVAMVKAVAMVESGGRGGFDSESRLLIRFEGHKFRDYTDRKFDASYPQVSYRYHKSHRSCGKFHSYNGFNTAFSLAKIPALLSCSIGMFQQMGFNYAQMGYDSVEAMWDDFRKGERQQLLAFVRLIKKWGLADEMRKPSLANCRIIAKTYNGEDYEANDYHNKIWNYYKKFKDETPPKGSRPSIAVIEHPSIMEFVGEATAPIVDLDTLPNPAALLEEARRQAEEIKRAAQEEAAAAETETQRVIEEQRKAAEEAAKQQTGSILQKIPQIGFIKKFFTTATVISFLTAAGAQFMELPVWQQAGLVVLFIVILITFGVLLGIYHKQIFNLVQNVIKNNGQPETTNIILTTDSDEYEAQARALISK